jgi:hypothetical protein
MDANTRAVAVAALIAGAAALPARADSVACHVTYGGETRVIAAPPVASPYDIKATAVGSYFMFRIVFRKAPADLAAIKVYAYADRDEGPAIIHQATWPYPPPAAAGHGFTGLHSVYEPVRDGELQYWCELKDAP